MPWGAGSARRPRARLGGPERWRGRWGGGGGCTVTWCVVTHGLSWPSAAVHSCPDTIACCCRCFQVERLKHGKSPLRTARARHRLHTVTTTTNQARCVCMPGPQLLSPPRPSAQPAPLSTASPPAAVGCWLCDLVACCDSGGPPGGGGGVSSHGLHTSPPPSQACRAGTALCSYVHGTAVDAVSRWHRVCWVAGAAALRVWAPPGGGGGG